MRFIPAFIYNYWRKLFGSYEIDDPRPIAANAPYTYYLPPSDHIEKISIGDIVKLIFVSKPAGLNHGAERMWVRIVSRQNKIITGVLDNEPLDMPQLSQGDEIQFEDFNIIDIEWANSETRPELKSLSDEKEKQRWDRCFVDNCVLYEGIKVQYIYREEPDMTQDGDKFPDSGWRIRGDVNEMSDEQYEDGKGSYVALGAVLNKDDSWIHLIDSPYETAFLKNGQTGEFEPTEFTADSEP